MRLACYIRLHQMEWYADERCVTPVEMLFNSAAGRGHLRGNVVLEFQEEPAFLAEDLETNLPLDDAFCSDLLIAAYGVHANTDLLGAGDMHCMVPNLAAEMERNWYQPLSAQQKCQQIAHALRLASSGVRFDGERLSDWHLELRDVTTTDQPAHRRTLLRVHFQPLGLETACIVARTSGQEVLTDEILHDDLLLPTFIVRSLFVQLYRKYLREPLPVHASSLITIDLDALVKQLLPAQEAAATKALIDRAIRFHY